MVHTLCSIVPAVWAWSWMLSFRLHRDSVIYCILYLGFTFTQQQCQPKIDLTIFGLNCKSFLSWDIKGENTLRLLTWAKQIHYVILEGKDLSDLMLNNKNACLRETLLLYCFPQRLQAGDVAPFLPGTALISLKVNYIQKIMLVCLGEIHKYLDSENHLYSTSMYCCSGFEMWHYSFRNYGHFKHGWAARP